MLHTTSDPGGSTIPQQLAKQLYGSGTGFGSTLAEIGLGLKLSFAFSHDQVLVMYLNAVYYGNGYWGDVAAARGYFHTTPNALSWPEAAMLAGLPQAPSAYDPSAALLARQAATTPRARSARRQPRPDPCTGQFRVSQVIASE